MKDLPFEGGPNWALDPGTMEVQAYGVAEVFGGAEAQRPLELQAYRVTGLWSGRPMDLQAYGFAGLWILRPIEWQAYGMTGLWSGRPMEW